jgi:putative acetyltransferase
MILVRAEKDGDAEAVRAVHEAAFGGPVEADIVDALRRDCPQCVSLVATEGGDVVGHVLFSPVTVGGGGDAPAGMGLGPMAVLAAFQRRGIGSRLVRAGIAALKDAGCPFIIVLGHPDYYPRFGFVPASARGLACPWGGVPDEAFMVLMLDEAAMAGVTGLVRYRPEFDEAT